MAEHGTWLDSRHASVSFYATHSAPMRIHNLRPCEGVGHTVHGPQFGFWCVCVVQLEKADANWKRAFCTFHTLFANFHIVVLLLSFVRSVARSDECVPCIRLNIFASPSTPSIVSFSGFAVYKIVNCAASNVCRVRHSYTHRMGPYVLHTIYSNQAKEATSHTPSQRTQRFEQKKKETNKRNARKIIIITAVGLCAVVGARVCASDCLSPLFSWFLSLSLALCVELFILLRRSKQKITLKLRNPFHRNGMTKFNNTFATSPPL